MHDADPSTSASPPISADRVHASPAVSPATGSNASRPSPPAPATGPGASPGPAECSVCVAVHVRPLIDKERSLGCREALLVRESASEVATRDGRHCFIFDGVYGAAAKAPSALYEDSIASLVEGLLAGYNATILAYGQTGAGKTYTMGTGADPVPEGVVPRAMGDLYRRLQNEPRREAVRVTASFVEIHVDDIRDLLLHDDVGSNVAVRETKDGTVVLTGATEVPCPEVEDMEQCLHTGLQARATAATSMNNSSSRSHAIFTVYLSRESDTGSTMAKIHFVDLAGSERVKRTGAEGQRLKEGIHINKGLLVLGNVISALCDRDSATINLSPGRSPKATHIPYRDSKLTRLLQDSLGGNSKTVMIACVSPADINLEETVNTLKYAARARNIKNKPIVNRGSVGASREVGLLRAQLAAAFEQLAIANEKNAKLEEKNCRLERLVHGNFGESSPPESLSLLQSLQRRAVAAEKENTLLREETSQLRDFLRDADIQETKDRRKSSSEVSQGLFERFFKRIAEMEGEVRRYKEYLEEHDIPEPPPSNESDLHIDEADMEHEFRLEESDCSDGESKESMEDIQGLMDALEEQLTAKQQQIGQVTSQGQGGNQSMAEYQRILVDLEKERSTLQEERDRAVLALGELEKTSAQERTKEAEMYRIRIRDLETKLRDVQNQSKKYTTLQRQLERSQAARRGLEADCQRIKQQIVQLSRKLDREAKKNMADRKGHMREIQALKRKEMKEAAKMKSMAEQNLRQQAVIKRKTEENEANKRLLKNALEKRAMPRQGLRAPVGLETENGRMTWVTNEIEKFLKTCGLQEAMDLLAKERELVVQRNERNGNEAPSVKESDGEIEQLDSRIRALQKELAAATSNEWTRWTSIRTFSEARVMLRTVFKFAAKSRLKADRMEKIVAELEVSCKDVEDVRQVQTKPLSPDICPDAQNVENGRAVALDMGGSLTASPDLCADAQSAENGRDVVLDIVGSLMKEAMRQTPHHVSDDRRKNLCGPSSSLKSSCAVAEALPIVDVTVVEDLERLRESSAEDTDDENLDRTWTPRDEPRLQKRKRRTSRVTRETEAVILDQINRRREENGVEGEKELSLAVLQQELRGRVKIAGKSRMDLLEDYCREFNIAKKRDIGHSAISLSILADSNR